MGNFLSPALLDHKVVHICLLLIPESVCLPFPCLPFQSVFLFLTFVSVYTCLLLCFCLYLSVAYPLVCLSTSPLFALLVCPPFAYLCGCLPVLPSVNTYTYPSYRTKPPSRF